MHGLKDHALARLTNIGPATAAFAANVSLTVAHPVPHGLSLQDLSSHDAIREPQPFAAHTVVMCNPMQRTAAVLNHGASKSSASNDYADRDVGPRALAVNNCS